MANIKYFSGDRELRSIQHDGSRSTRPANFSGYPEGVEPVFVVGQGWTGRVSADRAVEYKASPSLHQCDDRCINATGRVMKCECSCGGKNHGRGAFMCEAA